MEHYRLGSTRAILSRSFCNTDMTTDIEEIENILFDTSMEPSRKVKKMIKKALDAGGYDNVTVILIDLERS